MFKILSAITLSLITCMANASVLINVPGIGNTSIGCSPQCAINSAITLAGTYDPTQTLWDQVDNAGVPDGNTIIFSQGTIAPTTDTATHIQWNGSGSAGLGFVIGIWDLSVPVPASGAGGMPGFPVTFGNSNITGPQIAKLSLPIGQITTTSSVNGMSHYDTVIPALAITAGHNYGISIVAISAGWQWEIAANCSTSNYTGCIMNASTGLAPSTSSTMGGSIFHAAPVAFELTNDVGTTPPPTPPVINTTTLPAGTIGTAYSVSISTTVPTGDATSITVSGLPTGLSFDPTSNSIIGTTSVIGSSNVTITATDTTTNLSTSSQLTLTVNDIAVTFAPTNLPNATTNSAYTASFSFATGGYGGFTYTASGLPTGLALTGNTISGTPTIAGTNSITLTAVDSVGTSTSAIITLSVIDPVAAPLACSGTNAAVTAYVTSNPGFITVNGGLNLLDHLWTTNLTASNTTFNGGLINWYTTGDIVNWTGTVDPTGCILTQLTVNPRVTITTSSLPTGIAGTAYSTPISVTWGIAPYTTTVQGLPAGLTFNGSNITGTPTASGTSTVTISTVDAAGVSAASSALTLTVSAPAITSFSANLPAATVGTTYTGSVSASGGYGTLTYGATGLPAGLKLTGNTIAGTPTTAGTNSVSLTVTDSLGTTASTSGSVTVSNAVTNGPSCTKPATGATGGLNSKGTITAIAGNVITFKTKSGAIVIVTVPTCAKITWNGGAKAFAVGQAFEWNGYSSAATGNVAQSVTIN